MINSYQKCILKQPGFTYSACGPFTRNKERIEKFMQAINTDFINRNEFDEAYFQHDLAYGKLKCLRKITESDKVLIDKAYKIASDPKYDGFQRGLTSVVFKYKNSIRRGLLLNQISSLQINFINRLLEKFARHLEAIFWGLI